MAHYKVQGLLIQREEDIWTIPAMCILEGGLLRPSAVTVRIAADGIVCHPMTSGAGGAQQPENIFPVTPDEPLRGWGRHDCDHTYRVGNYLVPGFILEQIANWSPLRLPVSA